jgi:hypothetical protein
MSKAIDDVVAERLSLSREGYTHAHDDEHTDRELARAGQSYLDHYIGRQWLVDGSRQGGQRYRDEPSPDTWPWDESDWKPKDPRRDLVRAAALIIAEIERMDRGASTVPGDA